MRKIVLLALLCAMLLTGCDLLPRQHALPDATIPHRVATETTVDVWVRRTDGSLVIETVRVLPGWWIASPQVVGQ